MSSEKKIKNKELSWSCGYCETTWENNKKTTSYANKIKIDFCDESCASRYKYEYIPKTNIKKRVKYVNVTCNICNKKYKITRHAASYRLMEARENYKRTNKKLPKSINEIRFFCGKKCLREFRVNNVMKVKKIRENRYKLPVRMEMKCILCEKDIYRLRKEVFRDIKKKKIKQFEDVRKEDITFNMVKKHMTFRCFDCSIFLMKQKVRDISERDILYLKAMRKLENQAKIKMKKEEEQRRNYDILLPFAK